MDGQGPQVLRGLYAGFARDLMMTCGQGAYVYVQYVVLWEPVCVCICNVQYMMQDAWLDGLGPQTRRVLRESCREARVAVRHGFHLLPFAPEAETLSVQQQQGTSAGTWSGWGSCLWDMRRRDEGLGDACDAPGGCGEGLCHACNTCAAPEGSDKAPGHGRGTCDACDVAEGCAARDIEGFLGRCAGWVVRVWGCLDRQLQVWRARVSDALLVVDPDVVFGMADDIPGADWFMLHVAGLFSPPFREQRVPEVEYRARALDRVLAERLHLCMA